MQNTCISSNNLWQLSFLQFCIQKTFSFHSTKKLKWNIHSKVTCPRKNQFFIKIRLASFLPARHKFHILTNWYESFAQFCHTLSFIVRIKCLRMFSRAPEDGIAHRFVFSNLLGQQIAYALSTMYFMLRIRNKWLNLENTEPRDCNIKCKRVENGMEQWGRRVSEDIWCLRSFGNSDWQNSSILRKSNWG